MARKAITCLVITLILYVGQAQGGEHSLLKFSKDQG